MYKMGFYEAAKENGILMFTESWMELEIVLSETSHTPLRQILQIFPCM